jgi:hypothetical protein
MAIPAKQKHSARRSELPAGRDYTAAVRYMNGRSEIFCVRNAVSLTEARMMVENELTDVRSIVIALRPAR